MGPLAETAAIQAASAARAARGLWQRDASTWSDDPAVQPAIDQRLGWLDAATLMARSVDHIRATADEVRRAGFSDVVLLGMGGSSLAPEVLRSIVGVEPGWPRLHVLDTTDPVTVRRTATNPARTIYLLASKSGTTIEPNSLAAHYREVLVRSGIERWAHHFIAITDEGTALDRRANADGFRHVFINPSDIGGRYSALSYFGLVPAALMGQDIDSLLRWASAMLDEAREEEDSLSNPAVALGWLMAEGARRGRDKLTLVVPPVLEPFGLWVEQLVAESTGKSGVGIVPIAGETLGTPLVYRGDRIFVRLRLMDDPDEERRDGAMRALSQWPIATIDIGETAMLGAEFMRWEIATAVAGAMMAINPFDEPNVQQAKDATRLLLDKYRTEHQLPLATPDANLPNGAALTLTAAARTALAQRSPTEILDELQPADYLALLAFIDPEASSVDRLHQFRMSIRDSTRHATMLGFGPRYLHSTGQLHKGGANNGIFVLITAAPGDDVAIPGECFSFGTLQLAQALGDFASLDATGRRALHIHLPSRDPQILHAALKELLAARSAGRA